MGTRRKSRELALQMLFQADMGKQQPDQVRKTFWNERDDVDAEVRSFADDLFGIATGTDAAGTAGAAPGEAAGGAAGGAARIDGLIQQHAANWRLERMAAVDRNLLRAAVAEMVGYPQTPKPVIINEALEIARKFSNPESVNFINGVLDSIARDLAHARP